MEISVRVIRPCQDGLMLFGPGADCDLPQEIAPWNLPLCDLVISEMLGEDLGRSHSDASVGAPKRI